MREKEYPSKKRKKLEGSGTPTREYKFKLNKKPKKTTLSSEIHAENTESENEKSSSLIFPLPQVLNARIEARAYELYERRGGHHGKDLEDWVEAEREILSERL